MEIKLLFTLLETAFKKRIILNRHARMLQFDDDIEPGSILRWLMQQVLSRLLYNIIYLICFTQVV